MEHVRRAGRTVQTEVSAHPVWLLAAFAKRCKRVRGSGGLRQNRKVKIHSTDARNVIRMAGARAIAGCCEGGVRSNRLASPLYRFWGHDFSATPVSGFARDALEPSAWHVPGPARARANDWLAELVLLGGRFG